MSTLILSQQSEQHELQRRREELAQLETDISQRDSQLAGVKVGLSAFEVRYLTVVGNRYDELAKIEKQIAKLQGWILTKTTTAIPWPMTKSAAVKIACTQTN